MLAVCGLLLLAVALVFGRTVLFDFVNFDDDVLVYKNAIVARGVTAHGIAWAFTTSFERTWFPLTWISYMLDSQMYGPKPWGYHLTNVFLHAATSVILFLVLRQMTGNLWASACVALLFAIHPLRAEAVAWVSERKGALSGLFFVATIAAYVGYVRRPFSLARYLTVAALFTLGLMAKPSLVTLPLLLLLLDYWPLARWQAGYPEHPLAGRGPGSLDNACATRSASRLMLEKIPLLMLSASFSMAAVLTQAGNIRTFESVPIPARIANALVSYVIYLGQFFWPVGLAAFYPRSEDLPAWQIGGAFLVLAALSLAAIISWHRQPAVLVGWLWYLGMLVPMIGLVPIGDHARADRYTYLPQIGLCIAVVWGVRWGMERLWGDRLSRHWMCGVAGTLLAGGLMACAWQQTSYWQNSERLWTRALACTSNNGIAHSDLGLALADRGEVDEAIAEYRKALKIKPDNIEAHNDLGLALVARGQVDEAIAHYRKALEINSYYMEAHSDLGIALAGCGKVDEAIYHFRVALALDPEHVDTHYNLGLALAGRGQVDEAIEHFREAVEIKPDFAEAHNNLGLALAGRGEVDEAIEHFRKAVEIKPDYMLAHNNLGGTLASRGEVDEAIDHFRKALEIRPDYVNTHVILGDVLAGRGRLDEALGHYRDALSLASAQKDGPLADAIRERIKLHQTRPSRQK